MTRKPFSILTFMLIAFFSLAVTSCKDLTNSPYSKSAGSSNSDATKTDTSVIPDHDSPALIQDDNSTGSITITLPGKPKNTASRTITENDIAKYILRLISADGVWLREYTAYPGETLAIKGITPGKYKVAVEAYKNIDDSDFAAIGGTDQIYTVEAGKTVTAKITMHESFTYKLDLSQLFKESFTSENWSNDEEGVLFGKGKSFSAKELFGEQNNGKPPQFGDYIDYTFEGLFEAETGFDDFTVYFETYNGDYIWDGSENEPKWYADKLKETTTPEKPEKTITKITGHRVCITKTLENVCILLHNKNSSFKYTPQINTSVSIRYSILGDVEIWNKKEKVETVDGVYKVNSGSDFPYIIHFFDSYNKEYNIEGDYSELSGYTLELYQNGQKLWNQEFTNKDDQEFTLPDAVGRCQLKVSYTFYGVQFDKVLELDIL